MIARKLLVAASLLAFAFPAAAEEDSTSSEAARVSADGTVIRGSANSPWRGSSISYDHVFTSVSLDKSAELTWNPYYAQSVTLAPRYTFADQFFVTAMWAVEQELTNSDWTNSQNELIWSDLLLDLGWSGWSEPTSNIRITPSVRIALPLSKVSAAATQVIAVAPTIRLSRNFDLLGGLNASWSGRWTQRFHQSNTPVKDAAGIVGCDAGCADADRFLTMGYLNSWGDYSTGPSLVLSALDGLRFNADVRLGKAFLYDNAEAVYPIMGGERVAEKSVHQGDDFDGRYSTYFGVGASYDVLDELTLSAGVSTPSPQLGLDGQRRSLFFNRYTQFGVGLSLDVDTLSSRVFPRG